MQRQLEKVWLIDLSVTAHTAPPTLFLKIEFANPSFWHSSRFKWQSHCTINGIISWKEKLFSSSSSSSENRSRSLTPLPPSSAVPKMIPNHTEVIEFMGNHDNLTRNDFEMVTLLHANTRNDAVIETIVSVNHKWKPIKALHSFASKQPPGPHQTPKKMKNNNKAI